jgi:hypothetical protein
MAIDGAVLSEGSTAAANQLPGSLQSAEGLAGVNSPSKKKLKTGWLILGIAGSLILLLLCLVVGARILRNGAAAKATGQAGTQAALLGASTGTAVPATLTAQSTAAPLGTPGSSALQIALKNSVTSWSNGNMQDSDKQLDAVLALSAGDTKTLMADIRYLGSQQAWLPAAILIGKASQSGQIPLASITADQIDKIHEVFYNAARDPLSGVLFKQASIHPLMVAAKIRYQLYYGDPVLAQTQLGKLLAMPLQLKRFPEARLLQVEMSIQNKDLQQAKNQANTLLADNTVPVWVNQEAQTLKKQLNP